MPAPSIKRLDILGAALSVMPEKSGLTPTEASILSRIRRHDLGKGCRLTWAQLGQANPARPLCSRHTRRVVAALLAKGYLADLGRAPGPYSPRILAVLPRRDVPAASSQSDHR